MSQQAKDFSEEEEGEANSETTSPVPPLHYAKKAVSSSAAAIISPQTTTAGSDGSDGSDDGDNGDGSHGEHHDGSTVNDGIDTCASTARKQQSAIRSIYSRFKKRALLENTNAHTNANATATDKFDLNTSTNNRNDIISTSYYYPPTLQITSTNPYSSSSSGGSEVRRFTDGKEGDLQEFVGNTTSTSNSDNAGTSNRFRDNEETRNEKMKNNIDTNVHIYIGHNVEETEDCLNNHFDIDNGDDEGDREESLFIGQFSTTITNDNDNPNFYPCPPPTLTEKRLSRIDINGGGGGTSTHQKDRDEERYQRDYRRDQKQKQNHYGGHLLSMKIPFVSTTSTSANAVADPDTGINSTTATNTSIISRQFTSLQKLWSFKRPSPSTPSMASTATTTTMTVMATESQSRKKNIPYHSATLDEIINNVPSKFIETANNKKGLLSLIVLQNDHQLKPSPSPSPSPSSSPSLRGDSTTDVHDGKTPLSLTQLAPLGALGPSTQLLEADSIATGTNGWDYINSVLLGKKDSDGDGDGEGEGEEDEKKTSEKLNETEMKLLECVMNDINSGNYSNSDGVDGDNGDDDDLFSILSSIAAVDPDFNENDEKEAKREYPQGAWWIGEIESRGWFNHDTDNIGELNLDIANDGNNDFTKPTQYQSLSMKKKKDNDNFLFASILADDDFIIDKDRHKDRGGESSDTDTYDGKNGKNDNDSNNISDNEQQLINNVRGWKEKLWAAARAHYHKAFPSEKGGEEEEKENVARFRLLLEQCLIVYVNVFHCPIKDSGLSPELMTMLKIPRHVPVSLLLQLLRKVLRLSHEEMRKDTNEDINKEDSQNSAKSASNENLENAVLEALLDDNMEFFSRYEVKVVDIISTLEKEKQLNSTDKALGNRKGLPKRFTRRLIKTNNVEKSEVERFLYGSDETFIDLIEKKKNDNSEMLDEKPESEAHGTTDAEKEVKIKSSLASYVQKCESNRSIQESTAFFSFILLETLGVQNDSKSGEPSESKACIPIIPPSDCEASLSVTYALHYVAKFLLRCHMFKELNEPTSKDDEALNNPLTLVSNLLLDPNLVQRRISALGAYLSTKEYVNEWQSLRHCEKNLPNPYAQYIHDHHLYSSGSERETYFDLFRHLSSALEKALNEVMNDVEVLPTKSIEDEYKRMKYMEKLFDDKGKEETFSARKYLHISLSCMDIGRCSYYLGIDLGKSEKVFEKNGENQLKVQSIDRMEMSAYTLAIKAFREATRSLSSYRRNFATSHSDSQKRDIYDLHVSADLHLADSLAAAGFCYDTKLSDFDRALSSYREALSRYRHFGNYHISVSNALQNLGSVYYTMQNLSDALRCYKHRLSVLQRLLSSKDFIKNGSIALDLEREEAHTLKCIGKVTFETGDEADAIKFYEEALSKFRAIVRKSNEAGNHLEYRKDIADCLSEVSTVYMAQSRKFEMIWNNRKFREISGGTFKGEITPTDFPFQVLELERIACSYLNESISLRSESREKMEVNSNRNLSLRVEDLIQIAVLNFREQNYKESSSFLEEAWNLVASDSIEDTVDQSDISSLKSIDITSFSSTKLSTNYETFIPLLVFMGNVNARLANYDYALSCFLIADEICKVRISQSPQDCINRKGIELDIAKIYECIGYLLLKKGDFKSSASRFRVSLRLLDGIVNQYDIQDLTEVDEDNLVASIKKLARFGNEDFSSHLYIRISIGNLLNILGRVYEAKEETLNKALTCFEDSMLILDGIVEDIKSDSDLMVEPTISVPGSSIQYKVSSFILTSALADSYRRAGKIYVTRVMSEDGIMAFERAIQLLEDLKRDPERENEANIEFLSSTKNDNYLLELYVLILDLVNNNHFKFGNDISLSPESSNDNDDIHLTPEDLHLRIGNQYARMGQFALALKRYELAEELTVERLGTRHHIIVANIVHNIAVMQKELILINPDNRNGAEVTFKEAINISKKAFGDNRFLITESMVQIADMVMRDENWELFSNNRSPSREQEVRLYLEEALKTRQIMYGESDINVARTFLVIGKFHLYTRQTETSLDALKKAFSIYNSIAGFYVERAEASLLLGLIHMRTAEHISKNDNRYSEELDKALVYFRDNTNFIERLRVRETFGNNNQLILILAKTLFYISSIHQTKGHIFEAISCISNLLSCLRLPIHDSSRPNIPLPQSIGKNCNIFYQWTALAWFKLGCLQEVRDDMLCAMKSFRKSLRVASHLPNKKVGQVLSEIHEIAKVKIAMILCKYKQFNRATKLLQHCLGPMKISFGDSSPEVAVVLFYLAETLQLDQEQDAMEYYIEALHIFREEEKTSVFNGIIGLIHYGIAKIYYRKGQMRDSYTHIHDAVVTIEQYQSYTQMFSIIPISGHPGEQFFGALLSFLHDWDTRLAECYLAMLSTLSVLYGGSYLHHESSTPMYKLGIICERAGKVDEAFQCFYCALLCNQTLEDNDSAIVAQSLLRLSKIYVHWNKYTNSLRCIEECFSISSSIQKNVQPCELIETLFLLSYMCFKLKRLKEAQKWTKRGFDLMEKSKCFDKFAHFLVLKADIRYELGNCDEAIKILNEAILIQKKRIRALNTEEFKNIFILFGKNYAKKRNYQEALKYFDDSMRIQKEAQDDIGLAVMKDDIGDMFAKIGTTQAHHTKAFYSESLRIRTCTFGCDDINTAISLIKVAKFLVINDPNELEFAEKLLIEATRICHLFNDCYWLVTCYHTFGVLKEQTSPQTALQQYIDALDILDEQMNPPECLQSSLLYNIGRIYYYRQDYPLAVKYLKRSIEHKNRNSYDEELAQSLYLLGCSEYFLNELDSSLTNLESASQIFSKSHGKKSVFMLRNFVALAKILARLDKIESAISYKSKALVLWNTLGDPTARSKDLYMSFGELFVELGNLDKASEFFEGALSLQSTKTDSPFLSLLNLNLAIVHSKRGNINISRNYADKALDLCKQLHSDSSLEYASILEKIGDIESRFHDLNRAIGYYDEALLITRDRNDTENHARLLLIIGLCHKDAGNIQIGVQYFEQLLESEDTLISLSIEHTNLTIQAKQGLASSLFLLGDFKNALKLYMSVLKNNVELECIQPAELVDIHRCIGIIYLSMDKTRQAYHHFILSISSYENHCSLATKSSIALSEKTVIAVLDVYENLLSTVDLEAEWKENSSSVYDGYANVLMKAGDFKGAMKILVQILSGQESHGGIDLSIAATLYNLGNCSSILGQPANAVMFFERCLDIYKNNYGENAYEISDSLFSLSKAYAINFDFQRALPLCQKAIRLTMSDPRVEILQRADMLRTLGDMLVSSGEIDSSWEALTEALSIQRSRFSKAGDEISLTYFYVGKVFLSKGRYEEGLGFLKQVYTHSQKYYDALLEIGHVHKTRGEIGTAQEYYHRCFVLVQEELDIFIDSALFLDESERNNVLQVSRLKQSISNGLEKFHEVSKFAHLLKIYGILFETADRYEESIACFDSYLGIYKRDADVLYERGYSLYQLGRYPSASESLRKALQIFREIFGNTVNKQLSNTLKLLGECEDNEGHLDDALAFYREAQHDWSKVESKKEQYTESENFQQQKLLLKVGKMHQKKEEYTLALKNFEACVKIAQNLEAENLHGESVFAVGHLYFERGNYLRAIMNYQHAFEVFHDENANILNAVLSVGQLYFEVGRHCDALRCLKFCLDGLEKKHDAIGNLYTEILGNMGDVYFKMRAYDNAKEVYFKLITFVEHINGRCRESAKYWMTLADIYFEEERYQDALLCYERTFTILSDSSHQEDEVRLHILRREGSCYLYVQDFENAFKSLSEALATIIQSPELNVFDLPTLRFELGLAMYWLGNRKHALDTWKKAIGADMSETHCSKNDEWLKLDCFQKFLELVEEEKKTQKSLEYADALQKQGIYQMLVGDVKHAIRSHMRSLEIYKDINGANHITVGCALFNISVGMISQGSSDQAAKLLQRAYEITKRTFGEDSAEMIDILHQQGISYKAMNDFTAAKKVLEDAISILKLQTTKDNIKLANIIELIGDIAMEQQTGDAEKYFSESLRIKSQESPFSDMIPLLVKLSNLSVENGNYKIAINLYEKCVLHRKIFCGEKDSGTLELYLKLGATFECGNYSEKALICYDKCIKFEHLNNISYLKALSKKVRLLLELHRDKEAINCLEKVQVQDRENTPELLALEGQICERSNQDEKALSNYNRALYLLIESGRQNDPTAVRITCDKARLLLKDNHLNEAKDCLPKVFDQISDLIQAEILVIQGQILELQRDYVQATDCCKRASSLLSSFKQNKVSDYHEVRCHRLLVAKTKYLMGCIQDSSNDLDKALKSFKDSLIIIKKNPRGNEEALGMTMRKLGNVQAKKLEYQSACSYFKESIQIFSNQFGVDSIEVTRTLLDTAHVFHRLGDHQKVIYCCTEIIHTNECKYNEAKNSYKVGAPLSKCFGLIATTHDILNETVTAVKYFEQSIHTFTLCLHHLSVDGDLNGDERDSFFYFASILVRKAKLNERMNEEVIAMGHYKKAVSLYKALLGSKDNLHNADIFERMANIYGRQRKFDKSCILLETTLQIRIDILGFDHEKVAEALFSLGILFDRIKEFDAAMESFTDCLEIRQNVFGKNSLECADTLSGLGQCLGNQGDFGTAIQIWKEVISIYEKHGYDSTHPKIVGIEKQTKLAAQLLKKSESKWGILAFVPHSKRT